MVSPIYKLLRRLPFPEALVPIKMARGWFRNRKYDLPGFKEAKAFGGELEILKGIPVARLRGSPFEIGKQHGALVGEQASALYERYLGIFAGKEAHDLNLANRMLKHIPERFQEEMRGFAEGAGVSWEQVLLTTCFLDIHKVALCSTFVVRDQSSKNGEIVFGRNLDFPSLSIAHQASMLFVVEPEGKEAFVSVGWPGFLGVLSGINRSGLSLAMMLIYGHTRSDHVDGVPFGLHYRDILESYDNVVDATERLKKREFAVCNNMMLADAERDASVLELHTQDVGEIRDDSDFPVLRCSNHFRTGKRKWAMALTAPSSHTRMRHMNKAAKSGKAMGSKEVKTLLGKVAIPGINIQRMLFYPERRELEVAFEGLGGGERDYTYFAADELWGKNSEAPDLVSTSQHSNQ